MYSVIVDSPGFMRLELVNPRKTASAPLLFCALAASARYHSDKQPEVNVVMVKLTNYHIGILRLFFNYSRIKLSLHDADFRVSLGDLCALVGVSNKDCNVVFGMLFAQDIQNISADVARYASSKVPLVKRRYIFSSV